MTVVRPMKAPSVSLLDFDAINYPVLASPKLDGMRCMVYEGLPRTSSMAHYPNEFLNMVLGTPRAEGLDMELTVGPPNHPRVLSNTKSGLTSREGQPDFKCWVFDDFTATGHFERRLGVAASKLKNLPKALASRCELVPHAYANSPKELADLEAGWVAFGYEGIMVRDPAGPYHFGRCTEKQGWLRKVKRFEDDEAEVIGLEEAMHNTNEAERRGDGGVKRSTSKAGLAGSGAVGTIIGKKKDGSTIRIGPGTLTAKDRVKFWKQQDLLVGKVVTYKFFPYGTQDAPRHPTFKAIRDALDL